MPETRSADIVSISEDSAEITDILENALTEQNIPALQLSIRRDGELLYSAAVGHGDFKRNDPVSRQSLFRIASITKIFTAAAVMSLVQDGTIALNDTLAMWLPEFPGAESMTVRGLLSHSAGAPEPLRVGRALMLSSLFPRKTWTDAELMDVLEAGVRHGATPGAFAYSNGGYILLESIVERASGMKLSAFLEERVLVGADTANLMMLPYEEAPEYLLSGFDRELLPWPNWHRPGHSSWASLAGASGAMAGTADDLTAFMDALMQGGILRPEFLDVMQDFVDTGGSIGQEIRGYGLGIAEFDIDGRRYVGHSGLFMGFEGMLLHDPDTGTSLAILGNVSSFDPVRLIGEIVRASRFRELGASY